MTILTVFLKIVGFLSIPMVLFSTFMMVRSIGRARRITRKSLYIQLGLSPVFFIVYSILLGLSIAFKWAVPLVILGLGVGGFWAQSTDLSLRGSHVMGTRSTWYVILWGVSFAVTQAMALFASEGATAAGLATMCFSMGTAVGMNASLLLRHMLLLQSAAPEGDSG
ncbi:MAG: hypothetical protein JW846_03870 [Dehalococcoidia bacterium]|nr:hypothetical protein [Dehalococcoidia bacterium]